MQTCEACGAALPEDARFCPSCGAAVAESVPTGDERKLATVLFGDLVGSTALAEDEDPERVRALLDRFYEAMADEIARTGGTLEKFAGDAVMAVFGAPVALEDHAERALHSALAMQDRLSDLGQGRLALRIGINTGEVVVGRPREGSSFVTGDAVNVAARLEQAAEPGEILAGERTVAAAGAAFEFGELRSVEAKGKSAKVDSRPVVRALSLVRPRGMGDLRAVFVGRDNELELLRAGYRRAVGQREPQLVTIVGEPGVGKTTLVRELWERLAGESPPPVRRTGRCLPYGEGITYWPLGEILKEHFGILDSDPPEQVLTRLAGREILGLALGLDVAGSLHPVDARERLHASVVEFVEEIAANGPLVKLVEDIHWAEEDLLELLERIVRDARTPLVLVTTARPELFDRRPGWGGGRRNAATIWLEALPGESTSLMLRELLATELPARLQDLVVTRAEGNPFFVEELVSALIEAGALERRNGGWEIRDVSEELSIPDTVHAVLAARMDRLAPTEKAGLQAASVVGRTFWRGPVVHLLEGEEPDFDLLEERDFIRRRAGSALAGETEYAMKHALTGEVAYSSIPKARRGRLHAAFADWLIQNDRAKDEHASLLAYHYSEAVRPEDADLAWPNEPREVERLRRDAVRWLRRAAELAWSRYEMEEAVRLLTRATELTGDDHERSLLWRDIGHAQALRYDGEAFWDAIHRSLDGPLDSAELADTYSLLAFQTSVRSGMWRVRLDRAKVDAWIDRALELAPDGSVARAQALLARVHMAAGEVSDDVLAEASWIAETIGDADLRSFAFASRSHAAFERRLFDEADDWCKRRLALAPDVDDPDGLCEIFESAVPVAVTMGRFADARRFADEHWKIAQRLSIHHRVHGVSLRLELDDALGDWSALAAETDEVVDAVGKNLATPCLRNARDLLLLALAYVATGDESRARELERDAQRLAGEGHEPELGTPRLRMALERGDPGAIAELVRLPVQRSYVWGPTVFGTKLDALVALRDHDRIEREVPELLQPGTYPEPFALRALGAARGDDELLARAQERFAALGLNWHASQTQRLLAGL